MSKEISITFKISDKIEDLLRRAVYETDKNKSEIIRCCLLLSIDTVMNNPSLVNRLQIEDRVGNNT